MKYFNFLLRVFFWLNLHLFTLPMELTMELKNLKPGIKTVATVLMFQDISSGRYEEFVRSVEVFAVSSLVDYFMYKDVFFTDYAACLVVGCRMISLLKKNQELEEDDRKTIEQYSRFRDELNKDKQTLENCNKSLVKHNENFLQCNQVLTQSNQRLVDRNQSLIDTNQRLARDNEVLTRNNQRLVETNQILTTLFIRDVPEGIAIPRNP